MRVGTLPSLGIPAERCHSEIPVGFSMVRKALASRSRQENSPSGLWRTLGKRVGCKPSGGRIPQSPPCDESRDRSEKTQPSRRALVQHVGRISRRRGGTCACRACNDKNILVIIHSKNILVLSQTRIFWCTVNTRIFLHPHNLLAVSYTHLRAHETG